MKTASSQARLCLKYNDLTLYIIFLIKITNNYLKVNKY